jgi:hypothetical protein
MHLEPWYRLYDSQLYYEKQLDFSQASQVFFCKGTGQTFIYFE